MEHPLIHGLDQMSVDDLATKISDLQQKLSWAMRMNHGHMAQQLIMALESYQSTYQKKLQDQAKESSGFDFDTKIDVK